MKLHITREQLVKGIQTVYTVVPNKSTLPILSHLLLEAKDNQLRLTGTDLEIGITSHVEADVQEEGAVAVPAKRLFDLVKELPAEGTLLLNSRKNHQVSLECEKGVFKIMGLAKDEFPRLPLVAEGQVLEIDQETLKSMIQLTSFAVSRDESRYVLTGILFTSENGNLRLVATDGRRMAMIDREAQINNQDEYQVIVPSKAIAEIQRLLGEDAPVKISIRDNQIGFDFGDTQLISRLIEGKFPDYLRVIPNESTNKLTIPREEFLLATKRIALWSTQESPSVRLDLKPDQLVISKQTPEVGEAQEELTADYSGPEFSVGFNPSYITEVLKALHEDSVGFEVPGADKPGVIRTPDQYIYVVLPMQVAT